VATASGKANWNERICRVTNCPRPTRARDRLCRSHSAHRRTRLDLSVEAWLQLPSVRALASFGDCRVTSCVRAADGQRGLCGAHDKRWAEHRQACPDADFDTWAAVNGPAGVDHIVVLKGLPIRVQRELLVMVQQRTDEGLRTFLTDVRYLAELLRARGDVPAEADPAEQPHDLPATVLRTINEHLPVLQTRSGLAERRIVELLIDTGRRPDEVCTLPWDCLDRDDNGKPVLVYTDSKNNRPGRRLPIAETTAQLIGVQKNETRQRFPHTPPDQLVLLPCDNANPDGTKPMHAETFGNAHREFIDQIADLLLDEDNTPFDRRRVVPYAYRHSYAQRHADQGVAPDVLRELMGHRSMRTTFIYYRITETRTRAAVEKVARHQFDGTGRRVFHSISGLLADEHARLRIGQVAVPFGMCTEPSNVKAGGQACPYKYTCVGCGFFRSDPSYLAELKSYLQQLLADPERIRAATDLEDWARQHLAPPDEQIDQLRALIRRIEDDLTSLSDDDRDQIRQAITVIRQTRQSVTLGMPGLRPRTADRR